MADKTYYIVIATKKSTGTDESEYVDHFELKCEDEETARRAFKILKRSLVER
jgi:hypothetical protein